MLLDAFRTDAFSTVSLTAAVNKLPYVPGRLGELGIFKKTGIYSTVAMVEESRGKLFLIPTAARGSNPNVYGGSKRQARSFVVPHIPLIGNVFADDVQNIRAFGSETELQAVNDLVLDKLTAMRQSTEATIEFHRVGALHGLIKDSDGSTIYDLALEFGVTIPSINFNWATAGAIKKLANSVIRTIEDALGNSPYTEIHAMCGSTVYDDISASLEVRTAYERWSGATGVGDFLRDTQARKSFSYGGIVWEEYRGKIGTTGATDTAGNYFAPGEIIFFPVGAPEMFVESYSPANFTETVNTRGQEVYAKQRLMDWGMGVELHTQSNPLCLCTRPGALVKLGTVSGTPTLMEFGTNEERAAAVKEEEKAKEKADKEKADKAAADKAAADKAAKDAEHKK